jgi:hypothetical protein
VPWKYSSEDNFIEVIVDPDFAGDMVVLASARPIWIVDSPQNGPRIDVVWSLGSAGNLFEVSRCRYEDTSRRIENLIDILGCLDDHHPHHDIVVHGIGPSELGAVLQEEGFRLMETTPDGFVAVQLSEVRDRLIGRA